MPQKFVIFCKKTGNGAQKTYVACFLHYIASFCFFVRFLKFRLSMKQIIFYT